MPDDESPRPRLMRRLFLAIARAVALLILIAGFSGVFTLALPNVQSPIRYGAALLLGVIIFETLRPRSKQPIAAAAPAEMTDATSDALIDAQGMIDNLRSEAERSRAESQKHADSLTRDVQDLLEKNAGLRQQIDNVTAEFAQSRNAAAAREKQMREQFDAENTHVQRAAGKALDEIQKTRAANDQLRTQVATLQKTAEGLQAERESLTSKLGTLQRTAEALQSERESLTTKIAALEKQMASASQEMDGLRAERGRARREIEETRQKAEVEKASLRTTAESEWTAKMQQMSAVHAKQRDESQNQVRTLTARVTELQQQLEESRRNAQQLLTAGQDLTQQLDEERRRFQTDLHEALERERQNFREQFEPVTRQLEELKQRPVVDEKAVRDGVAAEWSAKLQKLSADHESAMGEAFESREAARAEVRSLNMKMQSLLDQLQSARKELAAARAIPVVDEKAIRDKMEADFSEKLQTIVAHMASDHEADVGKAIEEREAARAEMRNLTVKLSAMQQKLAATEATAPRAAVVDEKAIRQKLEAEFSQKLQTIVQHMATDHEADVGKAIEEREIARAEMRNLTIKLSEMQQKMASAAPAVDEKAIRETIEAEWSAKLQTIVNHMATDHESDVGKAIEEREAARAEARNLAIKMKALEQKLEGERQNRETLADKLRSANEEIVALRSVPAPLPPSVMPTEPMPVFNLPLEDVRQARADVLEFAEQANAVLRQITSPGTVPVPKVRILFVHHDPALRTLWRDNLTKNGFDVHTAVDGLEGLRTAMAEKPDVVIADASMPKMDGRELCQLIKSNQETASVKVILMTGIYTTEAPLDTAAREFEADEMLRKPVKFEAMKNALTSLLAARV